MERTIGDSLGQMTRGTLGIASNAIEGRILAINYSQRLLNVQAVGHANLRRVRVASRISLGTQQYPIVYPDDKCTLERNKRTGNWQCIAVKRKEHCVTTTDTPSEVTVDVQYSDSNITGDFGLTLTPYDTFLPPIEIGGNISLPSQEPPTTITICGITYDFCCDTSPPEDGMTFVFDSATPCIKWGFRRAPCPLYFRWQGAIGTGTFAPSVCVVGHYVYAVWGSVSETFLATYDVSDLSLPVLTNLQSMGVYGANLGFGIGAALDSLWVSSDSALTIRHFDITDRTTPVQVAEFSVPIQSGWKIHRHYDTGTMTFTGNPYLVGFHVDILAAPELIYNPFEVIDGYSGSVVGTLDYSAGVMGAIFNIVVCDNIVMIVTAATLISPLDLWGVDVFDPTTPTILWTDTPTQTPLVYLGGNQAYSISGTGHLILYTQTDIDNTSLDLGVDTIFTELYPYGWFLNSTCLYKAGGGAIAYSYSVSDFTDPKMGWTRTSPIETPVDVLYAPNSWIDKEDDILYIAQIGIGEDNNVYLSIFSNINT